MSCIHMRESRYQDSLFPTESPIVPIVESRGVLPYQLKSRYSVRGSHAYVVNRLHAYGLDSSGLGVILEDVYAKTTSIRFDYLLETML